MNHALHTVAFHLYKFNMRIILEGGCALAHVFTTECYHAHLTSCLKERPLTKPKCEIPCITKVCPKENCLKMCGVRNRRSLVIYLKRFVLLLEIENDDHK